MSRVSAYRGNEPYIFISYSHRDNDSVLKIIAQMKSDGYRVWFDDGIDPGTEWDENIAKHVESCGYFIAFISNNYISSDNCKDELNYARELGKGRLLVYLEQVKLPSGMAMRMNRLQYVSKYVYEKEADFYEKLYSAAGIDSFKSKRATENKYTATETEKAPESTEGGEKSLTYSNGDTYEGETLDGKRHGHGTYRFADGTVYTGEFYSNNYNGHGKMQCANGDVYDGEYAIGKKNGYGVYKFSSGKTYTGYWKDDKYHGRGKLTFVSGNEYDGEWIKGRKHGLGVYTFKDGTVYDGEFKSDEYSGHGKLKYASGDVYDGDFEGGRKNGYGVYKFSDGKTYTGYWKDDKYHGRGKLRLASGKEYIGDFVCGEFKG